MDKLTNEAARLLSNLNSLTETYGEPAASAALMAARMEALSSILIGFAATIIAFIAYKIAKRGYQMLRSTSNSFDVEAALEATGVIKMAIAGIATVVAVAIALEGIIDPIAWVGIARPEVWLAAKLL